MTEKQINQVDELLSHLNGKTSKAPWRMEQNNKTDDFTIFDKDFRVVADEISNEDDAIFIVNLVNLLHW